MTTKTSTKPSDWNTSDPYVNEKLLCPPSPPSNARWSWNGVPTAADGTRPDAPPASSARAYGTPTSVTRSSNGVLFWIPYGATGACA